MEVCWYLLKLGDDYIILFNFVYVWIFHNKKWKRKTHGEFKHINCQPNRGPGQVGQRSEEQLSDGHKGSTLCFLSKLDRPIVLSSNTGTSSEGFFIGITIHCSIWLCSSGQSWLTQGRVLDKVIISIAECLSLCIVDGFSSVQSLSRVPLFATPWTAAHQASLSITNSQSLLKLTSIESVMPSCYLILCHPLLLPSIFPSIRVFSNESALRIQWPKYWSFSFNISPSNEY